MKLFFVTFVLFFLKYNLSAQYSFESMPAVKFEDYKNWKTYNWLDSLNKIHHTMTMYNLDSSSDSITVQLSSFKSKFDSSLIRIYRNSSQIQVFLEPNYFGPLNVGSPVWVADFDGDGRKDIKIVIDAAGNGLASLNVRVIYLFQTEVGKFTKASFITKYIANYIERDFDNDGAFEIITTGISKFETHSYWTFNLYNFRLNKFVNVNEKHNYPLMVQFLHRENYVPTDKISLHQRKKFTEIEPLDIDIRK